MATGKKSFVLYCDLIHTVKKLTDEQAGNLFKHILKYVNDENPEADNIITEITFEPIKQQFKRDLIAWEQVKEKRAEAGRASAEARKLLKDVEQNQQVSTSVESVEQNPTKSTVNVNDNVNVNVNDNVIIKEEVKKPIKIDLHTRKQNFIDEVALFKEKYTSELLNAFYNYWTELNQSKTKMRFELEKTFEVSKRLLTWSKKEYGTNKQSNSKNQGASLEQIAAIADRVFGDLPDR